MTVTVLCFGHYSEAYPDPFEMALRDGATLADVLQTLTERDDRFAKATNYCRFAVNETYSPLDTVLSEADRVAILPPMSGG